MHRLADPLPGAVVRPEDLHLHLVVAGRRGLGLEGVRRVGKAHPGAHVAPLEAIDGGRLGHDGKLHFRLQDDHLAQFHLVRPRDAHGRAALLQDLLPVALQERGSLRVVLLRVGDDIAAPRRVLLEGAAPHPLPDLLPGKRLQGVPVEGRIEGRCGHALALDLEELLLCVGPRLQDELVPPGGRLLVRLDLSGEEAVSREDASAVVRGRAAAQKLFRFLARVVDDPVRLQVSQHDGGALGHVALHVPLGKQVALGVPEPPHERLEIVGVQLGVHVLLDQLGDLQVGHQFPELREKLGQLAAGQRVVGGLAILELLDRRQDEPELCFLPACLVDVAEMRCQLRAHAGVLHHLVDELQHRVRGGDGIAEQPVDVVAVRQPVVRAAGHVAGRSGFFQLGLHRLRSAPSCT